MNKSRLDLELFKIIVKNIQEHIDIEYLITGERLFLSKNKMNGADRQDENGDEVYIYLYNDVTINVVSIRPLPKTVDDRRREFNISNPNCFDDITKLIIKIYE